ncbi:MAG: hypothetical protein J7639_27255 [Paenibacillaceae bacterium]|nr:hypothetical protein [Paenibacillaceae bacterium]
MNNKRYWLKSIATLAILSLLLSATAWHPANIAQAAALIPPGYEMAAQSPYLVLYCNNKTGAIAVEDKRTGYVWKSVVDNDVYPLDEANDSWKTYMSSLLAITYTDLTSKKENVLNKSYSAAEASRIRVSSVADGVSVTIEFASIGIRVTLDMILDQDKLHIRIPAEQTDHNQHMGLVSMELMPFFGAARQQVDGYMFYPDGSGALTRFDRKEQRSQDVQPLKLYVYSQENVDLDEYERMERERQYDAMLPVYGVKHGNNAVLVAGTKGEEDTAINVNPDGYQLDLNRIGFEFQYRHMYDANLSNITIHGVNAAKNLSVKKADKAMIATDRETTLFFLANDDANYSGMANAYRDYLIEEKRLHRVIQNGDDIPLGLNLFMGIVEKRMLWDKFIAMTTFAGARDIIAALQKAGAGRLEVHLKGWAQGGYGRHTFANSQPDHRLGGQKGLDALADYAQQSGVKLALTNNLVQSDKKSSGFSSANDMAKLGNELPVANTSKTLFLLNPSSVFQRFTSLLERMKGSGNRSIAFDKLGKTIYHDYNKAHPMGRSETTAQWSNMLRTAAEKQSDVAVEGGNQYVLQYATRLYNIPLTSSQYRINDETIPFYQMVVHGMIPYTSEPGNLSYNLDVQKLRWVEYGSMPNFELTYKKAVNLKKTSYNQLFASYYEDWIQQVANISREFNQRLRTVWNERMVGHERVAEKVFKVAYSNGTVVYINYNDAVTTVEGRRLPALDYLVVERGGEAH